MVKIGANRNLYSVYNFVYVCYNEYRTFLVVFALAYMGNIWQNTYILHTERKNWLSALNICHANGINMQFNDWKYVNWYIRIKAERLGW